MSGLFYQLNYRLTTGEGIEPSLLNYEFKVLPHKLSNEKNLNIRKWNRTIDTRIFSPLLYLLSYPNFKIHKKLKNKIIQTIQKKKINLKNKNYIKKKK